MFNTKNFKIAKDTDGKLAYGIDIVGNKKYSAQFDATAIGSIPLAPNDHYAIFLASGGALFEVSYDLSFPALPVLPAGIPTAMTQGDTTLGPSLVDLSTWLSNQHTTLYIKALNVMTLTVHIYSGGK